jgi:hypothetical protein
MQINEIQRKYGTRFSLPLFHVELLTLSFIIEVSNIDNKKKNVQKNSFLNDVQHTRSNYIPASRAKASNIDWHRGSYVILFIRNSLSMRP